MQTLLARPATLADYPHFARLFLELESGDPVPSAERWASAIAPRTLFLEQRGEIVGYGYADCLDGTGYVKHVVVDPAHRGRGVGRRLMGVLADRLRGEGCRRWCLNVKVDNVAALRLYEELGLAVEARHTALRVPWWAADRLPRAEEGVVAREALPPDDGPLEAAFELPSGLLARQRSLMARVVIMLAPADEPGPPLGFASFDAALPGAFPFRVARPGLAAALLAAIRPHALPAEDGILLVTGGELDRVLRAAGAEVRFEVLALSGEIPAP